jgi:hypothetical protein
MPITLRHTYIGIRARARALASLPTPGVNGAAASQCPSQQSGTHGKQIVHRHTYKDWPLIWIGISHGPIQTPARNISIATPTNRP